MVSASEITDKLNLMLSLDPQATATLVGHRVNCSELLGADDSPFVCSADADGQLRIGLIGVLNSITSAGSGRVAAIYDESGKLTSFTVVGL